MSLNSLTRVWHWLKQKGAFFPANIATAIFLLWLIFPFFKYRSFHPEILGRYSLRFLIFLFLMAAAFSLYSYFAAIGGKHLNRALFLTVVGLFALSEISARLFFPGSPHRLDSEPKPYLEYAEKPNTILAAYELLFVAPEKSPPGEEMTNALGFRGTVPPPQKGNEYRIIVLGGSTAFAGFPLSNSIAGQLESLFHQDGIETVRVYNWGVPGYISGQELSLLAHKVLDYDPDLVIAYDGANDAFLPYFADPRPDYPFVFIEYEDRIPKLNGLSARYLLRKSNFLTWALTRVPDSRVEPPFDMSVFSTLRRENGYGTESWKESVASSYVANHRRMCSVARGGGFKFVTVLQPVMAFKTPLVGDEPRGSKPELTQYCKEIYEKMWHGLRQSSAVRSGVDCYALNVHEIFSGYDKEVFMDALHVTNEGNSYIAQHVYAEMKNAGLIVAAKENR